MKDNQMKQAELPCPFCGSEDISAGEVLTEYPSGMLTKQSMCRKCKALGAEAVINENEIDYGDVKANQAWNTRAKLTTSQVSEPVAQCTNSDSWNCKYCDKTESCEALKDSRNFGTPVSARPKFPVMLRKMWSGGEVQAWIDENYPPTTTPQEAISPAIAEGWISLKNRTPDIETEEVDLWAVGENGNGRRFCGYHRIYSEHIKGWRKTEDMHYYNMLHESYEVTHWMPLPSKPTGLD